MAARRGDPVGRAAPGIRGGASTLRPCVIRTEGPPAVGSGAEPLSGTALPLAPTSCPPPRGGYPQLPPHSTPSEANLERIDPAPTSRRDPAREPRRLLRTHCLHLRGDRLGGRDRKSTRLNSSHVAISYAVFCLKNR